MALKHNILFLLIFILFEITLNNCEKYGGEVFQDNLVDLDTFHRDTRDVVLPVKGKFKKPVKKPVKKVRTMVLAASKRSAPIDYSKDPVQPLIAGHVKRCMSSINNVITNVVNQGMPPPPAYPAYQPQPIFGPYMQKCVDYHMCGAVMDTCRQMRRSMVPAVPVKRSNRASARSLLGNINVGAIRKHTDAIVNEITSNIDDEMAPNMDKNSSVDSKRQMSYKDHRNSLNKLKDVIGNKVYDHMTDTVKDVLGKMASRILPIVEQKKLRSKAGKRSMAPDPIAETVNKKVSDCVDKVVGYCKGLVNHTNGLDDKVSDVVDKHVSGAVKNVISGMTTALINSADAEMHTKRRKKTGKEPTLGEMVKQALDPEVNDCVEQVLRKASALGPRNKSKEDVAEIEDLLKIVIVEHAVDAVRDVLESLENTVAYGLAIREKDLAKAVDEKTFKKVPDDMNQQDLDAFDSNEVRGDTSQVSDAKRRKGLLPIKKKVRALRGSKDISWK